MFHWICPECGGEIAPTVRECPVCDPSAAPVELTRRAGANGSSAPVSALVPIAASPAITVLQIEDAESATEKLGAGNIALAIAPDSAPDAEDIAGVLEVAEEPGFDSSPESPLEAADSPLAADAAPMAEDTPSAEIAPSVEIEAPPTKLDAAPIPSVPELTEGHADAMEAAEERSLSRSPALEQSQAEESAAIETAAVDSIAEVSSEPLAAPCENLPVSEELTAAGCSDEVSGEPLNALEEQAPVTEELTAAIPDVAEVVASSESACEGKFAATSEAERSGESERRGASPIEPGDLLELAAVVGMREVDDADVFEADTPEEAPTAAVESTPEPPAAMSAEARPETAPTEPSVESKSVERNGYRDPTTPPFSPAIDLQRTIAALRATTALPRSPQPTLLASQPTPIEQASSLPRSPVLDIGPVPLEATLGLETGGSSETQSEASAVATEPAVETASTLETTSVLETAPMALAGKLSREKAPEPVDAEPEVAATVSSTEESAAIGEEIDSTVGPAFEPPASAAIATSIVESDSAEDSAEAALAIEEAAVQRATNDPTVSESEVEESIADAPVVGVLEAHGKLTPVAEKADGREEPLTELASEVQSSVIAELDAVPDQDAEAAPVVQSATAAEDSATHVESSGEADVPVPPESEPEEEGQVTAGPQEALPEDTLPEHTLPEEHPAEASPSEASPSDTSPSEAPGASEVEGPGLIASKAEEEPVAAAIVDESAPANKIATSEAPAIDSVARDAEPDPVEAGLVLTGEGDSANVPTTLISGQAPEGDNKAEPAITAISAAGPSLPLAPLLDYRPATPGGIRPAQIELKILKPNATPSMTLPGPLLPPRLARFQEGQIDSGASSEGRSKSNAVPGWVVSGLVAIVLLGMGAVAVLPSLPHSNNEAKAISTPTPAESPAPVVADASYPLSKSVEVTGFRIVVDFNKKSEIHYLVVNHSSANLTGVNIFVTLQSGNAKAGQPPVCRFSLQAPELGPFESKEMISSIEKLNRSVNLPDWQDLRADVQVAP